MPGGLTPEQQARVEIDRKLAAAGWVVQDFKEIELSAARGVAVREFPTATGPADYLLYGDRKALGTIEAKKDGTPLLGVVSFSKHLVHVRRSYTHGAFGPTKSGRVRSVPLIDDVARVLDGLSRREFFTGPDDLVFVNSVGNPLDDARVRPRFYRALERAGLKRLRFHDLRHSFGTLAVQVFPLSDVKAYMGHADIQSTMVYVHHVPADDAAERLSRAVQSSSDFVALPVDDAAAA